MSAGIFSRPPGRRIQPATPASLANLVAWGEGSDLGADGTSIASWLNKTGSGLDPVQATGANQPTVKASAINGQKAAKFVRASNQFLTFPAGALGWSNGAAGMTLVAVVSPLVAISACTLLNVSVNVNVAQRIALAMTATTWRAVGKSSDDSTTIAVNGTSAPVVGTAAIVAVVADWQNGTLKLYVNGAQEGATQSFAPGAMAATNSNTISIGSRTDAPTAFDGYNGSYALWNVAYTRAQLQGALLRWSILYGIALS